MTDFIAMNDEITNKESSRLPFLDWMKISAMYFIIAGHCAPIGYKFIYVFSVPCFFAISGFLTRREEDNRVFWEKLWHNLVVPMFLFSAINFAFNEVIEVIMGRFDAQDLWRFPLNVLVGNQGQNFNHVGLGMMWFVYTLCIMKIIVQYTPAKNEMLVFSLLILFCIAGNIELSDSLEGHVFNAWVDVLIALPCYLIGYMLRPLTSSLSGKRVKLFMLPALPICIGLVILCGLKNEYVLLYRAQFGDSYLFYLIGTISGIMAVFELSRFLERIDNEVVAAGLGHFSNPRHSWNVDSSCTVCKCFRSFRMDGLFDISSHFINQHTCYLVN